KKKKEVVVVTSDQKPDQLNGSGQENGWKNRKGKAIAVDVQKEKPRKEYRQKTGVQGPVVGKSFDILIEIKDAVEVNNGMERGQQTQKEPEVGNILADLNKVNDLVDLDNDVEKDQFIQMDLGESVQQQRENGIRENHEIECSPIILERDAQQDLGVQNDNMGVYKEAQRTGFESDTAGTNKENDDVESGSVTQKHLNSPNDDGNSLEIVNSVCLGSIRSRGPGLCLVISVMSDVSVFSVVFCLSGCLLLLLGCVLCCAGCSDSVDGFVQGLSSLGLEDCPGAVFRDFIL
ncbi:unnamed protein product, partial [Ilex paraguariensis]